MNFCRNLANILDESNPSQILATSVCFRMKMLLNLIRLSTIIRILCLLQHHTHHTSSSVPCVVSLMTPSQFWYAAWVWYLPFLNPPSLKQLIFKVLEYFLYFPVYQNNYYTIVYSISIYSILLQYYSTIVVRLLLTRNTVRLVIVQLDQLLLLVVVGQARRAQIYSRIWEKKMRRLYVCIVLLLVYIYIYYYQLYKNMQKQKAI